MTTTTLRVLAGLITMLPTILPTLHGAMMHQTVDQTIIIITTTVLQTQTGLPIQMEYRKMTPQARDGTVNRTIMEEVTGKIQQITTLPLVLHGRAITMQTHPTILRLDPDGTAMTRTMAIPTLNPVALVVIHGARKLTHPSPFSLPKLLPITKIITKL